MNDLVKLRRALLSMSRKEGLPEFAAGLRRRGVELVSTGGTAAVLRGAGLPVIEVSELTGFEDAFDGRVKTLHPVVHGAILADTSRSSHAAALRDLGIEEIDLVAVGLYPFEDTVGSGAAVEDCVENIDIGGPAMIRAAAKNHARVVVLTDPEQYLELVSELEEHEGATTREYRQRLAAEAFARTAAYDAAIAEWVHAGCGGGWPARLTLSSELGGPLRYGENPHQRAAVYRAGGRPGAVLARLLQGKPCSYNNFADADAAFEAVAEFRSGAGVACAIVKHTNPCGVAIRDSAAEAFEAARLADPESAFGGVVAFNAPLDRAVAEALAARFLEVVIAPEIPEAARQALAFRAALRVLETGGLPDSAEVPRCVRSVAGGYLVQEADHGPAEGSDFMVVSRRQPSREEWRGMQFAWRVVKHVKSNAIVLARDEVTLGVGAGQMSRVDSVRVAAAKAAATGGLQNNGTNTSAGVVLASDAFFPFADGVEEAAKAGVRAVIQPGGSRRDEEVVAAGDAAGMSMVFTGKRHFRH